MNTCMKVLKNALGQLPDSIGRGFNCVPMSVLLGCHFSRVARLVQQTGGMLDKGAVVTEVNNQFCAVGGVPIYQDLYGQSLAGISISSLEELSQFPIIEKKDLKQYSIEDRSLKCRFRFGANTGGTSGQPLHFYLSRQCFAHEWAHMLYIWQQLGYRRACMKLTFRGTNLGKAPFKYNAVHNEYIVNAYLPWQQTAPALLNLLRKRKIEYIHGYPSIISDFAHFCAVSAPDILSRINKNLKGVFLASEYPAPHFRNIISDILDAPNISWYGHSEMAILAFEYPGKPYRYNVMSTYGYAEAIENSDGSYRLIGTSFGNNASPFIRYDTGDQISDIEQEDGVLRSFRIREGRIGDFIYDKIGHRVGLTALIHGRHHAAFSLIKSVQVAQSVEGRATLHVVAKDGANRDSEEILAGFDLSGVDVDFELNFQDEPYRTKLGKLPLLIP